MRRAKPFCEDRPEQSARGKRAADFRACGATPVPKKRKRGASSNRSAWPRAPQATGCGTTHRDQEHPHRKEERRKAAELEKEVGEVRTDRANPIARRACAGRWRGNVERSVVRRVGEQAESEQDREAKPDEADQLVESFIFSRCKDPHDDFPFFSYGRSVGCGPNDVAEARDVAATGRRRMPF